MEKIFTLKDIKKIAVYLLKEIKLKNLIGAKVLYLSGELGSGKTTLTKEIATLLGVREKVVSPTFVIMKKYKTKDKKIKNLIHMDAYRLDKKEELVNFGWEEILSNKENLIIVEWPERVFENIKDSQIKVFLEHQDNNKRKIKILV